MASQTVAPPNGHSEMRFRELYREIRTLREVVEILRGEVIKTNHRVAALEAALSENLTEKR